MKIFAVLRVAARALRRNIMRTILTMLGMIIGVGAVIATVSLGNGAKSQVEAQIASLGQNVILIFSGSFTRGGIRSGLNGAGTLSVDDAFAIEREIPDVSIVSPEVRGGTQVAAGNQNWGTSIQGESHVYRAGCPRRQQGRGDWQNRRGPALPGRRSHRPGHPHQKRSVHRRRRTHP